MIFHRSFPKNYIPESTALVGTRGSIAIPIEDVEETLLDISTISKQSYKSLSLHTNIIITHYN